MRLLRRDHEASWRPAWGARGLEHKIMDVFAAKKTNLSKRSCGCKEWLEVSPQTEGVGLVAGEQEHAIARDDGVDSDPRRVEKTTGRCWCAHG